MTTSPIVVRVVLRLSEPHATWALHHVAFGAARRTLTWASAPFRAQPSLEVMHSMPTA
jgi:hypothetical protein